MNNQFIDFTKEEIMEINGGSLAGWGTILGGASLSIATVIALAATTTITAPAALALGVVYLGSKAAVAIGIGEVTGAIKY